MLRREFNLYLVFLILMVVIGIVFPFESHAVPAGPDISEIIQPDGTVFEAKVKGDEWNNWVETVDGYSIERGYDGYWYYISYYDDGTPVLSDVYADEAPPMGVAEHIRPAPGLTRVNPEEQGQLERGPYGTFNGEILFILAEFTDRSGTFSEADFASLISNNISDYFSTASYGEVTLSPANESSGANDNGVVNWVNLGYNHPNTGSITSAANQQLTADAIIAADPYVDFSAYDTNGDGYVDADELAVVVVVAGYERAYSASYSPSVWGHRWVCGIYTPTVDGVTVGDSHGGAGGYAQFGEIHQSTATDAHQATMGIMVHELGHLIFGLPDFYDTDGSSEGIGAFGVMGGGTWGRSSADTYSGETPVLPCAWIKYNRGWVSGPVGSGTISIEAAGSTAATSSNTVYRLLTSLSHEYFMVENRQPLGYDRGLERWLGTGFGGLTIWHIDDNQTSNRNECYPPSDCTSTHYWVALEQADGNWDLEKANNRGNATDLWYSGNATTFDDTSTPNSNLYDGTASNVSVTDISASDSTMTATVTSEPEGPITHVLTPPSDTTVSPGEILGPFFASLTNNTGSYYEFYAQSYFITAIGVTRYRTQRLLRFGAGETRDFTRYISVPNLAQEGTCTFGVKLTETGGSLISDHSFDFTVVSGPPPAQKKSSKRLRRLMRTPGVRVVERDGWKMIIIPGRR